LYQERPRAGRKLGARASGCYPETVSGLKGLLSQAERIARKRGQPVTTAHVLLAIYQRSAAGAVLGEHGVSELQLIETLALGVEEPANVVALALERAEKSALLLRHGKAGAIHLLLALTREPRSAAYQYLERIGAPPAQLQRSLQDRLEARAHGDAAAVPARPQPTAQHGHARQSRSRRAPPSLSAQQRLAAETERKRARDRAQRKTAPDVEAHAARADLGLEVEPVPVPVPPRVLVQLAAADAVPSAAGTVDPAALDPERFPLLAALGRNLCSAALLGQIDPVLGRDDEIEQALDVLSRRRANNPVLVGPPGVGKTAVAMGIALALARARDPRVLIELSAAGLVSGTGVRGALSERVQAIAQEVARAGGRVLLFIDEIHSLIGADEGADTLTAGLKSALARGELPCVGATTDAEYRRIFERDAALVRRFTRIDVDEPSPDAALAILTGLAPEYERHHGLPYAPGALRAAVDMSVRFMSERHLPDKAVALIDQAAARVRRRGGSRVDVAAIAEVVSEHAAVPLERLLMRDGDALLALESHLEQRVVGQREAIAAIADALRKSAAGFRGQRPLGTFLFLGPTGVGKTEMAKAISELLFPGGEMTRIDMSELSEPHAVARLLGAPPGYVGHEEGGQLTEPVRRRPYQLVLLDEVEKAHREVLLALLPLLDEARITDGRGRTVDFSNTVIVMTSNLGVAAAEPRARVGFGAPGEAAGEDARALQQRTLTAARQALPPELWNRIDEPLYFHALDRTAAARIAERMTAAVAALVLREHGVHVRFDASVFDALIAAGGHDSALGARPMRRTVGRLIEAALARAILAGELVRGAFVMVRGRGDQLVLEASAETPVAAE
jgi:ATP-dependent Clp protease ATP-binding subunit ClpC